MATRTLSNDNLVELYGSQTLEKLRQESMWMSLLDQGRTTRWAAGEIAQEKIPIWDGSVVTASDRERGGAWAKATSVKDDQIMFGRTGGVTSSVELDVEDVAEVSYDILEETRSEQEYKLKRKLDSAFFTAWTGAIKAGQTTALGTSGTDTISISAPWQGAGKGFELIWEAIDTLAVTWDRSFVDSMESDSVGRKFMVLPVELMNGFANWMLNKGYSWDALTEGVISSASVGASGMWKGRIKGIDLFRDSNLAVPASASQNWKFYGGVRAAARGNIRRLPGYTQIIAPSANQISDHPAHLLREAVDYGFLAITKGDLKNLNRAFTIDAVA